MINERDGIKAFRKARIAEELPDKESFEAWLAEELYKAQHGDDSHV